MNTLNNFTILAISTITLFLTLLFFKGLLFFVPYVAIWGIRITSIITS